MSFTTWDEIRTAYQVARVGTVSGAAEVLGVHHATVIRHVDALEERLGTRLFQRHARGYTPTEAGQELLKAGQATEEHFAQLHARITGVGTEVSGELVVTSLPGLAELVTPALAELQGAHPGLRVRYLTDTRVFRLEYGEAHVAIRAGARPEGLDNVVQSLSALRIGMYAARAYAEAHGLPETDEALPQHRFVGPDNAESRAPYYRWVSSRVPASAFVFRTNSFEAEFAAVRAGLGIGFLPAFRACHMEDLVQVMSPRDDWQAPLWLVTHVDLHRTPKVQAFLAAIKASVRRFEAEQTCG